MSSFLGIAAVTQVLKGMLSEGLADSELSDLTPEPTISALPPDKILVNDDEPNRVNLYMYMSQPNTSWRNNDLPVRNTDGQRISNPPLVLDLHYVLSGYGSNEIFAEMLLGNAMMVLHKNPAIGRAFIQEQLTPAPGPLPEELDMLEFSGLQEQIKQITISQDILSTEEVSRLWTSFGAKHRQSAYYIARVVLLESKQPARVALPVRKPLLYVHQFKRPVLHRISSKASATHDIVDNQKILLGYQLVLKGEQLKGEVVSVMIGGQESDTIFSLTDTQIVCSIPTGLTAGIHGVYVVHKIKMGDPPTDRKSFRSNAEAFVLSPSIGTRTQVNVTIDGVSTKAIQLQVNLSIGERQNVELLLNQINVASPNVYSFPLVPNIPSPAGTITIPIENVVPGDYLIRISIDNAISPIASDYQAPIISIT